MAAILSRPHCVNLIIDAYTDSLNIISDTKQPIQYSCKIKAASLDYFTVWWVRLHYLYPSAKIERDLR